MLTETFIDTINNYVIFEASMSGFIIFDKARITRSGGGVRLFIATGLRSAEIIPRNSNKVHTYVKDKCDTLADRRSVTFRPPGKIKEIHIEIYQVLLQTFHNNEAEVLGEFSLPTLSENRSLALKSNYT